MMGLLWQTTIHFCQLPSLRLHGPTAGCHEKVRKAHYSAKRLLRAMQSLVLLVNAGRMVASAEDCRRGNNQRMLAKNKTC